MSATTATAHPRPGAHSPSAFAAGDLPTSTLSGWCRGYKAYLIFHRPRREFPTAELARMGLSPAPTCRDADDGSREGSATGLSRTRARRPKREPRFRGSRTCEINETGRIAE